MYGARQDACLGPLIEHGVDLVRQEHAEPFIYFVVKFFFAFELFSLVDLFGRGAVRYEALTLESALILVVDFFVTVFAADEALAREHAFPAGLLLNIAIIDEVVVEIVEALILVPITRARCLLGLVDLGFLFLSDALHVAAVLLHWRQSVIILDSRNHGLDKRIKAVLARADAVLVVTLRRVVIDR